MMFLPVQIKTASPRYDYLCIKFDDPVSRMKRQIFFLPVLLFFLNASAQDLSAGFTGSPDSAIQKQGPFDYGLSMGTQVASFSGYGTGVTSWITPRVSYKVGRNLMLGGGLRIANTGFFVAKSYRSEIPDAGSYTNFSTATVFVNGLWTVNDRLRISGSAFKQIPISQEPLPFNPFLPIPKYNAQGVNVNVDYRIGKGFFIQAGFRYSRDSGPGYPCSDYQYPFETGFNGFGNGLYNPY